MTFSNVFTNSSLTAANLQRVVAEMMSLSDRPLAVHPDTLVVPPAIYGEWLCLCVLDAERELKHTLKVVSRAILSGHYARRQRQRVAKMAAYRLQRRQEFATRLPGLQSALVKAQRDLTAWQEQQAKSVKHLDYTGAFFDTTRSTP